MIYLDDLVRQMREKALHVHCSTKEERRELLLSLECYGIELDDGCREIAHEDIASYAGCDYISIGDYDDCVHGSGGSATLNIIEYDEVVADDIEPPSAEAFEALFAS